MDLETAHRSSFRSRRQVEASDKCGCFYCLAIFDADAVIDWTDEDDTPLCPKCGIDSVLASASDAPIDSAFLKAMQQRWFW